jgi:hypothetical protein
LTKFATSLRTVTRAAGTMGPMFRKSDALRLGVSALAASTCLLLAGCGGPASASSAAGGGSPAGGSNLICTSFEQAYQAFLAGATPPDRPGNTWDELINASGNAIGPNIPSAGVGQDIFNLMNIATSASSDLSQSQPINQDVAHFNSDLRKVGKDCGTAFTPAKTSS